MFVDPQRFNLYAYARNNPLLFVDPTGQRIMVSGSTEEERNRELAAIQGTVGADAGKMLHLVKDKKDGNYYVEIKGDAKKFAGMNEVSRRFRRNHRK